MNEPQPRTIQASTFKAQCLALLEEVATTHRPIVVTKRGRAIAKVVPLEAAPSTLGSVTLLAAADEEYFTTGAPWNAEV